MDRLRRLLSGSSTAKNTRDANSDEYEPLRTSGDDVDAEETANGDGQGERGGEVYKTAEVPFSWFEYTIFTLVGVAMLWAWYDTFASLSHPGDTLPRATR